ncbi:FAD-binding domain-containing protein [Oceaniglobus roseus]|uniref:FAD-binding domain-containing protein n=1 Tax=Oceaniglobus roseus TaxID=1737570 RepID=UPI000C7EA441|nr:FAD-binding domain-containing protein [Kandeliimicrobium roseum]
MTAFAPTRAAALDRLQRFVPDAAERYALRRNHDAGQPTTSQLSPWLRHRLITEREVLHVVLDAHGGKAAEKFISELLWRSYWKGWLEMRPAIWRDYRRDLDAALNRVQTESGLRRDWEAACRGETGIACFDHWARDLTETGWLHNHARMWFASIWIFTLRLPWELGADLFLRQLLDGDPASNTLGWRWVAGIQTRGKHYVATADNIRRYTGGRFDPAGQLDEAPDPLDAPPPPEPGPLPASDRVVPGVPTGLLLMTDDLSPGFAMEGTKIAATFATDTTPLRSPLKIAPQAVDFAEGAASDTIDRLAPDLGEVTRGAPEEIVGWARSADLRQVVLPHVPTGPGTDALDGVAAALKAEGIRLVRQVRAYDATLWPHARKGFFRFRHDIPDPAGL